MDLSSLSLSLSLFLFPRLFVCGLFWMLLGPILDLVWFQVEFHQLICGKICTWERFKASRCVAGLFSRLIQLTKTMTNHFECMLNTFRHFNNTNLSLINSKIIHHFGERCDERWCEKIWNIQKKFLESFAILCYLNGPPNFTFIIYWKIDYYLIHASSSTSCDLRGVKWSIKGTSLKDNYY